MLTLATVLLLHTTREGVHHDWLIERPPRTAAGPAPQLWAARVDPHSRWWTHRGVFALRVLPPHRRRYLTYQGPVSGGRGRVRRVDGGQATPLMWRPHRAVLDVKLGHFRGRLDLRLPSGAGAEGGAEGRARVLNARF